jgi:hypothetical protein
VFSGEVRQDLLGHPREIAAVSLRVHPISSKEARRPAG